VLWAALPLGVVLAAWALSQARALTATRGTRTSGQSIILERGVIAYQRWSGPTAAPVRGGWTIRVVPRNDLATSPPMWFRWTWRGGAGSVWVPLWPIALVAAAPVVVVLVRARGRAGRPCERCGYDLAGLPGGPCPECGTLGRGCASSTSQRG
jgi:hypothetical protein